MSLLYEIYGFYFNKKMMFISIETRAKLCRDIMQ